MSRSLRAVLAGTFLLRFASGITGGLLVFYLKGLGAFGGETITPFTFGLVLSTFYVTELTLSPIFGVLSDRIGHHRIMEIGPMFGILAAIITGLTVNLWILGGTRLLEGASTAASVPSVLGFVAVATQGDELLRGRISARFEAATVAGAGGGVAAAGVLWNFLGRDAFFVNAGFYVIALLVYRYGVSAADAGRDAAMVKTRPAGPSPIARYAKLLRSSHVWLLAPTWIALNAALGLYTSQTLFQLIGGPDPRFPDQFLVGGFAPLEISGGFVVAGVVFFGGMAFWGDRFKRFQRTTIITYGLGGGAVLAATGLVINHSGGVDALFRLPVLLVAGGGLFVLAGATPAAIGLLADMSEHFPDDRGALMGLYSVFFSFGAIIGLLLGGAVADWGALDGIFLATLALLVIALIPLSLLRRFESSFAAPVEEPA